MLHVLSRDVWASPVLKILLVDNNRVDPIVVENYSANTRRKAKLSEDWFYRDRPASEGRRMQIKVKFSNTRGLFLAITQYSKKETLY